MLLLASLVLFQGHDLSFNLFVFARDHAVFALYCSGKFLQLQLNNDWIARVGLCLLLKRLEELLVLLVSSVGLLLQKSELVFEFFDHCSALTFNSFFLLQRMRCVLLQLAYFGL